MRRSGRTERISRFTNCLTEMINRRGFGFQPPLLGIRMWIKCRAFFDVAAGRTALLFRRSATCWIKSGKCAMGIAKRSSVKSVENLCVVYGNWDAVLWHYVDFYELKINIWNAQLIIARCYCMMVYIGEMSRPPTALFSRRRFSICLLFFYYCKKRF